MATAIYVCYLFPLDALVGTQYKVFSMKTVPNPFMIEYYGLSNMTADIPIRVNFDYANDILPYLANIRAMHVTAIQTFPTNESIDQFQ
jgi:hypothetical protein